MPVYCYEDEEGRVYERHFSIMAQIPPEILLHDGRIATRSYQSEHKSVPPTKGWPLECVASGVNASQAGQLAAHLASKGVPTEVTRDGNPVYRNANHRRRALRARGMFDRASFV